MATKFNVLQHKAKKQSASRTRAAKVNERRRKVLSTRDTGSTAGGSKASIFKALNAPVTDRKTRMPVAAQAAASRAVGEIKGGGQIDRSGSKTTARRPSAASTARIEPGLMNRIKTAQATIAAKSPERLQQIRSDKAQIDRIRADAVKQFGSTGSGSVGDSKFFTASAPGKQIQALMDRIQGTEKEEREKQQELSSFEQQQKQKQDTAAIEGQRIADEDAASKLEMDRLFGRADGTTPVKPRVPEAKTQGEQVEEATAEFDQGTLDSLRIKMARGESLTDEEISQMINLTRAKFGTDAEAQPQIDAFLDKIEALEADKQRKLAEQQGLSDIAEKDLLAEQKLSQDFSRRNTLEQASQQKEQIDRNLAATGGEFSTRNQEMRGRIDRNIQRSFDFQDELQDLQADRRKFLSDVKNKDLASRYDDAILQVRAKMEVAEAEAITDAQKLNAANDLAGDKAVESLMKVIGESAGGSQIKKKFNKDLSLNSGFVTYIDDFGNESVKTDKITGKPVAFAINPDDNPDYKMIVSQFDGSKMLVNENATNEDDYVVQTYNPDNTIAYTSPRNYANNSSQVSATDVIPEMPRPRNTGNVANDLNNPNNLVKGGVGDKYAIGYNTIVGNDGVSRDFLVFDTVENGIRGMAEDFKAKVSGGSAHIRPQESLDKLADVWVGGAGAGDNYKAVVSQMMGTSLDTPIQGLDPNRLATAFAKAEGFTGGAPIKQTAAMQAQAEDNQIAAETVDDMVNNLFNLRVGQGKVDSKDAFQFKKSIKNQIQSSGGISPLVRMEDATAIKKQITNLPTTVKEIDVLAEGGNTMKSFDPNTDNPGEDVRLIFAYMKSIDPTSVVRESEFETAQRAVGTFAERFGQDIDQALKGTGKLSPEMRRKIINSGLQAYNSKRELYSGRVGGIEKQWGRLSGGDKSLDPGIYLRYNSGNYDELVPSIESHVTIPLSLKQFDQDKVRAALDKGLSPEKIELFLTGQNA